MKCIYCVEEKSLSSFTKAEHVVPQSFGLFNNNFTLKNTVCDDCNQYFGKNLEIIMARDTLEGTMRFESNIKSVKQFKSLGKRGKIKIKIMEGEFKGAYAYREYSETQNKIIIKPVPQIGFLKKQPAEYKYYPLDQIPYKNYLDKNDFDMKNPKCIRILGIDIDAAQKVLYEKGIKFEYQGEVDTSGSPQVDWLCKVEEIKDITSFRTIAKIAFNYLAFWEGKEFLLHHSFDPTRSFIRYGTIAKYPIVMIDNNPILGDESIKGKSRLGHIVTVNWTSDKISIVSQVSLLNLVTYKVSLARNFIGQHRNIRRGHFFNVNNKKILVLEVK